MESLPSQLHIHLDLSNLPSTKTHVDANECHIHINLDQLLSSSHESKQLKLPPSLDTLPNELLIEIAEQLENDRVNDTDVNILRDLLHLSLVNKHYNAIAVPILERRLNYIKSDLLGTPHWDEVFVAKRERSLGGPEIPSVDVVRLITKSGFYFPSRSFLGPPRMVLSSHWQFAAYVSSLCQLPTSIRKWALRSTLPDTPYTLKYEYHMKRPVNPQWAWNTTPAA